MPPSVKERLRTALTALHEKPLEYPEWGISGAMLREFTARERQYANDAVQEQGGADPDQILFRAMLMQRCITDPATGRPYADGRTGPSGSPLIDPRTRTPIFTVEEITELADGRAFLFTRIWDDLIELAAAAPASLFRGDRTDDGAERDQGAGDQGDGAGTAGSSDQGTGNPDGGGEVSGDVEQGTGDTVG